MGANSDEVLEKWRDQIVAVAEENEFTIAQLEQMSSGYAILAKETEDALKRELYEEASELLKGMAGEASELKDAIQAAGLSADDLPGAFDRGAGAAKGVREAIKKWFAPLDEAKGLLEDILGLTSKEDIILRDKIAPILKTIAERSLLINGLRLAEAEIMVDEQSL